MKEYTIYCTTEQTKKALELGAPIFTFSESFADGYRTSIYDKYCSIPPIKEEGYEDDIYADIPTTEQMIGWLRKEHNIHVRIDCEGLKNYVVQLQFINSSKDIDIENNNYKGIIGHKGYPSISEATLSAIDTALEYLSKNKK